MKVGPIIAIASAVVVTGLLVTASRTPEKGAEAVSQEVHSDHDHSESVEGMSPLDAKVNQAVEIIQSGSQSPMVAIGMLKEVLEEDPQHIGALTWLGEFSIQSGQLDRAEGRFLTILAIEPNNLLALDRLLKVYASTGETDKSIAVVQEFLEKNQNHPEKEELESLLATLREQ